MSIPETPRTWTGVLVREDGRIETQGVTVPTPRNFGVITVYEAGSVDDERERLLDLLRRAKRCLYPDAVSLRVDIEDCLREDGRLGKEES